MGKSQSQVRWSALDFRFDAAFAIAARPRDSRRRRQECLAARQLCSAARRRPSPRRRFAVPVLVVLVHSAALGLRVPRPSMRARAAIDARASRLLSVAALALGRHAADGEQLRKSCASFGADRVLHENASVPPFAITQSILGDFCAKAQSGETRVETASPNQRLPSGGLVLPVDVLQCTTRTY